MQTCFIGIDVGLTTAKAAAFDDAGRQLHVVAHPNPRVALAGDRQEIDMDELWAVVALVLRQLTGWLAAHDFQVRGIGATGHGNGLYLVDEALRPVRAAIASTDTRAEHIVAGLPSSKVARVRAATGSLPWAGQPGVLLRWLHEHEAASVERARWMLSCKDWLNLRLTGKVNCDLSDASGGGLIDIARRDYAPAVFDLLGLPRTLMALLPTLSASGTVIGATTDAAAQQTGLGAGIPVVAGLMDCVASPIGAGAAAPGDVTIIVGTWAINSVVVPAGAVGGDVTLNALAPDPRLMFAQEVAPTSAANIEWLSTLFARPRGETITPRQLLADSADVAPGAVGLLFLPFIHGTPAQLGSSGTLLGARASHGARHVARAVVEGIAQYHRVQLQKMRASGAVLSDAPWTLTGGGAKNPLWAQVFADVIGHPVRRQLDGELGARGVASLAARGTCADSSDWLQRPDPALVVEPGPNRLAYRAQSQRFDAVLAAMGPIWMEMNS